MEIKKGYKHTEIGQIPEDWTVEPINNLFEFQGGSQPSRNSFIFQERSGYIRLLQIRDYKNDNYACYIPISLAKRFCKKDDIMIGRYGPPIFQIFNGMEGSYNVALIKAIPKEKITRIYGWYILKQKKIFDFVDKLSQRSSGQTGVDLAELRKYLIPLPTKSEQIAIANVLNDTDSLIVNLEKLIEKKRNIKQGAMQQLLKPKKGWESKKLGEIGECIIGLTYSPKDVKESGMLVLRSSNIKGNALHYEDSVYVDIDVPEKLIVKENDILICVRNGSRDLIGKCTLIKGEAIGETFGAFMSVFRSPYNEFVFHCFQSNIIKKQIDEHLGATINQITNKSLNSFEIPFPATIEQDEIVNILRDMDNEIVLLEKKLIKYKMFIDGMMQELLTGKKNLA